MICMMKFTKGHNSIKSVSKVRSLALCISSNEALYLYQVLRKYLKAFRVIKRTRFADGNKGA